MKVGIDARIYQTGIGRYVQNLIKELEELKSEDQYVVFLRGQDFEKCQLSTLGFSKIKADCPPYSFKEQLLMPFILAKTKVDLVHFTNFNVPVLWWGKYVLTIHDLIHQQHSTFGSTTRNKFYYLFKKLVYLAVIRWVAFRATKIIVPSYDAKGDVVKYLWVKPEKVVVTYEGIDKKLKTQSLKLETVTQDSKMILRKYGITGPYLLYVATMYPHKNHKRLTEAFRKIIELGPNPQSPFQPFRLQLVLVGKVDHFSSQLKNWVEANGLGKKVIFPNFTAPAGYISDKNLAALYANAALYVFPSLKEGFGIPILEAWQFDLPVITSYVSSLPEVGGDAVLYFDPRNVDDMVKKIQQVLANSKLRQFLIQKGEQRLKKFSWQKMAAQTLDVYREVFRT